MNTTGYLHPLYAESLREFGSPRLLPTSQGYILERTIPGGGVDGMGCYPIFACQRWSNLSDDFEQIGAEIVSLTVVTDPFGQYNEQLLRSSFPDLVRPYKAHFVIDLAQSPQAFVSKAHRRNVAKALANVTVEHCLQPIDHLATWRALYGVLIARHQITGIARFSSVAFADQLQVPGLTMFRALHRGETVGMMLWYIQNHVAYYHLAAYNEEGYELRSSFALFWEAINYFAEQGLEWLSLGAGAGVEVDETDGLTRFKQGWSTGTRTAYLCGRVFDTLTFTKLIETLHIPQTQYFPGYRYTP